MKPRVSEEQLTALRERYRPKQQKASVKEANMRNDDLRDAALERQDEIRRAYRLHEADNPVMFFDIQEQRIYAYPYFDYKRTLSQRSQAMLEEQYDEAQAGGKIVVFVTDEAAQRLISFALDYE